MLTQLQLLSRATYAEWRKAWSTMGVPIALALSALPGIITFIANRQSSDCVECGALDVVPQNLALLIIPAVTIGAVIASGDFLTADPTRQQATGWVVNHGAFLTTHVALLPDVAAFGLIIPEQLPHNTFFYPELLERVTRSDMTNAAVLVAWAVIPLVVAWMVMMRREWK